MVLAIRRLPVLHALFAPPMVADVTVVRRNVPFPAHPRPDRHHHDDDTTDAYPQDPRHAMMVADPGARRKVANGLGTPV